MTSSIPQAKTRAAFARNAFLTAGLAALANVIIYLVSATMGWFQTDLIVYTLGRPIPLYLVIIASLTSVLIAAGIKGILERFNKNHKTIFLIIALAVLIGSLFPPLGITGAALSMKLSLIAMHVIGGIIAIIGLNR